MSQLKAGLAFADITPPVGVPMAGYGARDQAADSVETPLITQGLVLESAGSYAAIAVCDLIAATADITAAVREQVSAETDIPADAIIVAGSHTHWGPELRASRYLPGYLRENIATEYIDCLKRTIAGVLISAWRERTSAAAGCGCGLADGISFNRRPVGADGKVAMNLALPPEHAMVASRTGLQLRRGWEKGAHLGPRLSPPLPDFQGLHAGVSDPDVPLLKLVHEDGTGLCGLINFACHPVVGGDNNFYAFSPDYPWRARQAFEAVVGAPMLFSLGCAGDQVPAWRGGASRVRVGHSLGAAAVREWVQIQECSGDVPVGVARKMIDMPVREFGPVEEARKALEACEDPEGPAACAQRNAVALAEKYGDVESIETEIAAVRVGDWALAVLPGEVMAEIGLQIKQKSSFPVTAVMTVAYDSVGYISTANAQLEGGYEPTWSPAAPEAERVFVDAAVELLDSLR